MRPDAASRRAQSRMAAGHAKAACSLMIFGMLSVIVYLLLGVRWRALGVLNGLLNIVPVLGGAVSIALALLAAQ